MQKLPVALISGFLGAGKTTLLNRILAGDHGLRIAVLVNDFGSINIDAALVRNLAGETIDLANGCVCCTIRSDLVDAVAAVLEWEQPPQYIVIETSGVSDPNAAAMGLVLSPGLAGRVMLDIIVTVVDAENLAHLEGASRGLATDQVTAADIVLLNKTDIATGTGVMQARAWISAVAPRARIHDSVHCDVPWPLLLDTPSRLVDARRHEGGAPRRSNHDDTGDVRHDHGREFASWAWTHDEPLALEAIYGFLQRLPAAVYRAKGILHLAEVPERRVVVHVVGRRVQLTKGPPWGEETPASRLVMIGPGPDIQAGALAQGLEQSLQRNSGAAPGRFAQAVIDIMRNP